MRNYLTETVGAFVLVLTVGLTVLGGPIVNPFAPLAIGSALMVMVYMGGHISGGHYNPAVSLAVCLRGKLPPARCVGYIAAQLVGAIVAGLAVRGIRGASFAVTPNPDASILAWVLVEFLYTGALCLVVLNVATSKKTEGNSFYGLAIGFTVVIGAFAGGNISGGAFNPAVGVGPALVHAILAGGTLSHLWLYIVVPFAGSAAAALIYRLQNPADEVSTPQLPPLPPAHG